MSADGSAGLRARDGHHAKVTNEELFFDLVYVFAITQLSHVLLHHLSPLGALQTLILWFAVWLGWQYTCWTTNWFDPERPAIRLMLFASMLAALVMASAIPEAFGARGLVFALAYVAIQVGRTLFVLLRLGGDHALAPNFRRMLGWLVIAAAFWIAGGFAGGELRIALWIVAVLCEYVSPMFGFPLPWLGRSSSGRDWTIEGGHLAERCQLLVIIAFGETILTAGAPFSSSAAWTATSILALLAAFVGTLAMWWLYFGVSSRDATRVITQTDDPGRIGARLHYAHAVLVGGIIVTAVGNDLVIAHPHEVASVPKAMALAGGPALYLLGSAIYKRVVYGRIPISHVAGIAALVPIAALSLVTELLVVGWLTTLLILLVGFAEPRSRPPGHPDHGHPA
jgi:low temperature requirement protein LtrA